MNRFLYVSLITVITIIGFAMYTRHDLGSISIQFADFKLQMNLLVFGAALLSSLFIVLLVIRSLQFLKSCFSWLFSQRKNRLQQKARAQLKQGLLEHIEGKFSQAEKTLLGHIHHSDNPLLAYLTAAQSAHKSGAPDRRDNYLRKARELSPEAEIAIGLTQARLQREHDQNEQALATLKQLNRHAPGHFSVLQLLAGTYHKLEAWDSLQQLMPELKKYGQLSAENILDYEIAITHGHLNQLTRQGEIKGLEDGWNQIARPLQNLPAITEYYACCLIELGNPGKAENVLRLYLDKNWHDSTITLYSELDVPVDNKTLDMVESWLKAHPQNPYLLLALGKICLNLSLWGKARTYFEACIAIQPLPETYLKLARLLEKQMRDSEAAAEYYRQGLHLLVGNNNEAILETSTRPVQPETEKPLLIIVQK